jgi:hypothetical protein
MDNAFAMSSVVQSIYKHVSPSISKSVMHILKNQDDTDDVMQDT